MKNNDTHIPKLDLFLDVNTPHLEKFSRLLGKELGMRESTQFKALRVLLCSMFTQGQRQVRVSRRKKSLGGKKLNPLDIKYNSVNGALDKLEANDYIIQILGSHKEKKETTMEPTDKLMQWFEDTDWSASGISSNVGSYVTLRENKKQNDNKVYIDYEDTKYSIWLNNELKQYNELLNESRIVLTSEDGKLKKPFNNFTVQRAFIKHDFIEGVVDNTEFVFGGRMAGPWVNLSSEARKRITIDGEKTIELDRGASHLNAMYQVITGAPYPYDDPYDLTIDGVLIPRHIVKNLASFSQGATSSAGVASRVGRSYSRKASKENAKQKDIDNHKEWQSFVKKVPANVIHKAFLKKHSKIANSYLRGKAYGDLISCWESDIVFEVVMELTRRGVPCLTVYDSFIVPIWCKDLVDDIKDRTPYIDRRGIFDILLKN